MKKSAVATGVKQLFSVFWCDIIPSEECYLCFKGGYTMTQQKTFRSSLNGFNREDVVTYIEYLNSTHTAEINQLNSELDYFRNRQPISRDIDEVAGRKFGQQEEVIEQQAARIRELFDRCKELEEKLQAVLDQQNSAQARAEEELEAYRRAERMERQAKERAEQLCQQANGALADASIRVDEAAEQIAQMSDRVMEQLAMLQKAVSGTKVAMKEASQIMYAIRPEEE